MTPNKVIIIITKYCILLLGMVFNISAGFSGLVNDKAQNEQNKNYALFVGDTVLINEVGSLWRKLWVGSGNKWRVAHENCVSDYFDDF